MLQQVMTEPGKIIFREIPVPEIGDGQVLVKIMDIGVCGSDIHVYHGKHRSHRHHLYEIFRRIYTPVAVCRNCNKLLRCLLSAFPNIGKYTYRYCLRNLVWCGNCTNKPSWLVG